MLPELCLALLAVGITAYAVLGGADFGAGIWDLTAGGARRGGAVRALVERSMSPVWEANHVWLIFVLVVCWTAFPVAFASFMSTLALPLAIAVLGIAARGTAFALRGIAATISEARVLGATFALSSLIVPFCLGAAAGAVASGRVPLGNAVGDPIGSWLNPTSIVLGCLAVLSGAYLAAVFMAADAQRSRLAELPDAMRRRALIAGVLAGAVALGALPVVRADAPELYDGLTSGAGPLAIAVSALAGIAGLTLVWRRRFALARWVAAVALIAVTAGWLIAQRPYILPGRLTVADAAAPDGILRMMLICVALGLVILIPSLLLLYRSTLQGRLDERFVPMHERFERQSAGHANPLSKEAIL